jgi:hypothetical protein
MTETISILDSQKKRGISMKLFDDGIQTYNGIREPRESIYQFLNRSAQSKYEQARNLLEKWFQDYPEPYRSDLGKRIRSKLDEDHLGAFFELYCYSLLRYQGYNVKPQQVVDQTKGNPIDFLVQSIDTPLFYLEATVAMDVNTASVSQRILRELWDALNTLQEPNFQIELYVERESTHSLPIKKICSDIHEWLQTLDPNEVSMWKTASTEDRWPYYDLDGWKIVFIPKPKPSGRRGKPGNTIFGLLSPAQWRKPQNSLKAALKEKEDRYGDFELPYIIAIDVLAINSFGSDVEEILFGQEVALFDKQSGEIAMTRSPLLPDRPSQENGFWLARRGPRNRHVSAVLLVDELMPWSIAHKTPVLWHNPWAEKPLSLNVWQGPQMIPNMDGLEPYMQERVGKESDEIFHLHVERN